MIEQSLKEDQGFTRQAELGPPGWWGGCEGEGM